MVKYSVFVILLHGRIFFRSNFFKVLTVFGYRYRKSTGIKYPVTLFYTGRNRSTLNFGRFFQINHCLHIIFIESNPTSCLVISITFQSIYQSGSTVKFILFIYRLQHSNRLHACLVESYILFHNATVSCRTNCHSLESTVFFEFQRFCILCRCCGRFTTIQRVINRTIINSGQSHIQCSILRIRSENSIYIKYMSSIIVLIYIIYIYQSRQTFQEVFIILLRRHCPLHFCQSSHTGQFHIFYLTESRNIFSPQVSLYTFYILLFFRSEGLRHRFIRIHSFDGQITTNGLRLILNIFRLIVVKIQISIR